MSVSTILTTEMQEKILLALYVTKRSSSLRMKLEEGYTLTAPLAVLLVEEPGLCCLMCVKDMTEIAQRVLVEALKDDDTFFFQCVSNKNFYLARYFKTPKRIEQLVVSKKHEALKAFGEDKLAENVLKMLNSHEK